MQELTSEIRAQLIDFLTPKISNLSEEERYIEDGQGVDYTICEICEADDLCSGASKIVLIYNEFPNWVVKIPLLGIVYYDEDDWGDCTYEDFVCAAPADTDLDENDYCAAEEYFYQRAVDYDISELFAGTYYLASIDSIPVYVSEAAGESIYDTEVDSDSRTSAKCLKSSNRAYRDISELALAHMIEQYGEDKAEVFCSFVSAFGIDDFHNANFGFTADGRFKVIDYSGYYE